MLNYFNKKSLTLKSLNISQIFMAVPSLSSLICEDLARQDPIAPVVRALGPDLVVALLLDGPQKKERWSHRYSSALVDEPGCSVLSISPYGMTQRSTNGGEYDPSSIVALWCDTRSPHELELEPDKIGILLILNIEVQK